VLRSAISVATVALALALVAPRAALAVEIATEPVALLPDVPEAIDLAAKETRDLPAGIRAVLEEAAQHIGTPYRWGGTGPKRGFDCSGLVNYVFRETVNVVLPRAARDLARLGTVIRSIADLRPGDLVFFNTRGRRFSHVGIFLGGTNFIHAPRRGARVRIDDLTDRYFAKRFNGGRRLETPELARPPVASDS
jgi:cell wall-associated NlpC family hydrolase